MYQEAKKEDKLRIRGLVTPLYDKVILLMSIEQKNPTRNADLKNVLSLDEEEKY